MIGPVVWRRLLAVVIERWLLPFASVTCISAVGVPPGFAFRSWAWWGGGLFLGNAGFDSAGIGVVKCNYSPLFDVVHLVTRSIDLGFLFVGLSIGVAGLTLGAVCGVVSPFDTARAVTWMHGPRCLGSVGFFWLSLGAALPPFGHAWWAVTSNAYLPAGVSCPIFMVLLIFVTMRKRGRFTPFRSRLGMVLCFWGAGLVRMVSDLLCPCAPVARCGHGMVLVSVSVPSLTPCLWYAVLSVGALAVLIAAALHPRMG